MSSATTAVPPTSPRPQTASQASATTAPQRHATSLERPRQQQRQKLDLEDDDTSVTVTAVDTGTPAAVSRSSQTLRAAAAAQPKDDDIGSEYAASSDDEDDDDDEDTTVLRVPAKRRRESGRLRGDRAPTPRSPISERGSVSRGVKRSHSRSVVSVVVPERARASKRPMETGVHAGQRQSHLTQKPRGVGAGRTGINNRDAPASRFGAFFDALSHQSEYDQISRPRQPPAGSQQPASRDSRTIPKPIAPAAVMQFLSGIGLGQSHLQMLLQEGIRTQQDLDGLQEMEKDSVVELRDVLRARGFTAFEFSKVEYAIARRKD
ncbi:hypothetical protein EI94DRAFT_900856 [Lactarius quietus]|nr:hypothetical protein EI94DRAFT_900856 [Lactarius quietus]